MSYIGKQPSNGSYIPLPLSIESGGTSSVTAVAAKAALGIISGENDGTLVESGTTAQRGPATQYKIRFNIDTGSYEGANGAMWAGIGGGARNDVFFVNKNTLTTDTTISSGENAICGGPVTIADGVTLTIEEGGTLTVVGV